MFQGTTYWISYIRPILWKFSFLAGLSDLFFALFFLLHNLRLVICILIGFFFQIAKKKCMQFLCRIETRRLIIHETVDIHLCVCRIKIIFYISAIRGESITIGKKSHRLDTQESMKEVKSCGGKFRLFFIQQETRLLSMRAAQSARNII